ncbi:MAG: acyl-ACP desaturase [Deltaproteobacteria bacterium]|nr:acyl-ACP desaturase [Nannocystaceae bacterium]
MTTWTNETLLHELEPIVARELDRHLSVAREWMPHEYIPWAQGRDFAGVLGGEAWSPGQSQLNEDAKVALVLGLLTEDNLPSYHREIHVVVGHGGAWGTWIGRWTAEEGRHAMAMRDYLLVTRAVDPVALERERMLHMSHGFAVEGMRDLLHTLAYVSFQELATRVSHRNTGRCAQDPVCEQLLARIAADENLHMVFYRNLVVACLELAPDPTMVAIADVVERFQMPGSTVPDFGRRSLQIAIAGIYDLRIHHDEVLLPILRHLEVVERATLGADGERARDRIVRFIAGLDERAGRFEERRAAHRDRVAQRRSVAATG